jgi:hypothetical protein
MRRANSSQRASTSAWTPRRACRTKAMPRASQATRISRSSARQAAMIPNSRTPTGSSAVHQGQPVAMANRAAST